VLVAGDNATSAVDNTIYQGEKFRSGLRIASPSRSAWASAHGYDQSPPPPFEEVVHFPTRVLPPIVPDTEKIAILTKQANCGDTRLFVHSWKGFEIGDKVAIGVGEPVFEGNVIKRFGSIIVATPLQNGYPKGTIVSGEPHHLAKLGPEWNMPSPHNVRATAHTAAAAFLRHTDTLPGQVHDSSDSSSSIPKLGPRSHQHQTLWTGQNHNLKTPSNLRLNARPGNANATSGDVEVNSRRVDNLEALERDLERRERGLERRVGILETNGISRERSEKISRETVQRSSSAVFSPPAPKKSDWDHINSVLTSPDAFPKRPGKRLFVAGSAVRAFPGSKKRNFNTHSAAVHPLEYVRHPTSYGTERASQAGNDNDDAVSVSVTASHSDDNSLQDLRRHPAHIFFGLGAQLGNDAV
jgi:hypothetical protein